MEQEKYMLATTQADEPTYEDYLDYCEANEIEPAPEDSTDVSEWCNNQVQLDWEIGLANIKCEKRYNVPVICAGYLGLWDGRHPIYAKRFESVRDAVDACMGRDIEQMDVEFVNGGITVTAYHHDGRNVFRIRALNKKGLAKVGNDYKEHDMKKLPYLYN